MQTIKLYKNSEIKIERSFDMSAEEQLVSFAVVMYCLVGQGVGWALAEHLSKEFGIDKDEIDKSIDKFLKKYQ